MTFTRINKPTTLTNSNNATTNQTIRRNFEPTTSEREYCDYCGSNTEEGQELCEQCQICEERGHHELDFEETEESEYIDGDYVYRTEIWICEDCSYWERRNYLVPINYEQEEYDVNETGY